MMADWTKCTWRTYDNGMKTLKALMGYKCMVAFKYLFFKGHEDDYTQAKYEEPDKTNEEFIEDLEEFRRKYPDGKLHFEPDAPPKFTVDENDSEQVLIRGIIALVNALGIEGMLEFMAPYENGDGTYSEGWTERPEGLAESIIECFRALLAKRKAADIPVKAAAEAEAVLA
ncbi:MAG: hypothetical protein IJS28_08035 [Synergistaceae bacterium]|nr:hypothetical protein [Synergistaceae bacterium]